MSQVKVSGNASGTGIFEIAAPNASTNYTLTLPQATTTLVGTDASQTLTNKTYTNPTFSGTASGTVLVSGTAQASTSGTSIDFTGIPSWVKRITVMFAGVSTNGSSTVQVQLGTSGGVQTSGYLGTSTYFGGGLTALTTGFGVVTGMSTAVVFHGNSCLTLEDSSGVWTGNGAVGGSNSGNLWVSAASKSLSGTLDRVRITTVNGTDTFDAGSINILYE